MASRYEHVHTATGAAARIQPGSDLDAADAQVRREHDAAERPGGQDDSRCARRVSFGDCETESRRRERSNRLGLAISEGT